MGLFSKLSTYLILLFSFVFFLTLAGTFTTSSSTSTPTPHTLLDINNLVLNNSTSTGLTHSVSTTSSPNTTYVSISEIYANLANLIQQENIKTGVTYLGITGNFGVSDSSRYTVSTSSSSLTPSTTATSTGYTLDDIYTLINSNSTTTEGNHPFNNSSSVSTTLHSLNDIYIELSNLIQPDEVASGTTYLGVLGTYKILSSIEITTPADTLSFTVGDSIDITGLVVTGTYSDESTAIESVTINDITGFDSSSPVTGQILTITVGNATTTYTVDIVSGVVPCDTDPITGFSAGAGTSGSPYEICNWTQLSLMRTKLSSYHLLTADISSMTSDYSGIGDSWTPVGMFSGNFNGNNNTISDLVVSAGNNSGLFSQSVGTISNIGLINISVTGSGNYTGGLAGWQGGGSITNSYSSGSVTGTSGTGEYVGGLVGLISGTITNSYTTGSVTSAYRKVGGLAGQESAGSTISGCYSTANVTGIDTTGGLVGYSVAPISSSYSTGIINGRNSVGGLVGQSGSTVSNSYSTASVISNTNGGGLVGYSSGTITNSYSLGSVTGNFGSGGGLVGDSVGAVINSSYWDTETSGWATSDGGTGKTTAEMKTQGTFSGWDFNTVWNITSSYPFLR